MSSSSPYTVDVDPETAETLLADWRWLTGEDARVILVTALGDALFARGDGSVWLLDTCAGAAEEVEWPGGVELEGRAASWLGTPTVDALRARGVCLGPGQCYGYKLHPTVGGDPNELDNFEPTSIALHFSLTGQLHEQVRALPDGAEMEGSDGES